MDFGALVAELCRQNPQVPRLRMRAALQDLLAAREYQRNLRIHFDLPRSFTEEAKLVASGLSSPSSRSSSSSSSSAGQRSARSRSPRERAGWQKQRQLALRAGARRQEATLTVRCQCGDCCFQAVVQCNGKHPEAIRCFCRGCRRFHTCAFGAFVALGGAQGPQDWDLGSRARSHRDRCSELGAVNRLMCRSCFTKLATVPLEGPWNGGVLLALGAVEDHSIPKQLGKAWRREYQVWQAHDAAAWGMAAPGKHIGRPRTQEATGGCVCGACEFKAPLFPGEALHCYCSMCRQHAGSVSMTWVPVQRRRLEWMTYYGLRLTRTSPGGRRHMCTRCGCVLTILYDAQPETVWVVAGALDDDNLDGHSWHSVKHIYCSSLPPWYELPDDGLARLAEGS